jgi:hypothetical protein
MFMGYRASISHNPDHRPFFSLGKVGMQPLPFHPVDHALDLLLARIGTHNNHHKNLLFNNAGFLRQE